MDRLHIDHDGLRHAALDWGGGGVPLVLLHPNGFCAGSFGPLAEALVAEGRFRPVAIDLRGHGGTDKPDPDGGDYSYEAMAGDVIAVLDRLGIAQAVLLGNSLGGGVAALVDRLAPGRARHLLLCEAICIDPGSDRAGRATALADLTLRRRAVWPSREAMLEAWRTRPPLSELAPEALEAYIRWGTLDRPDGQVELACPPEVESLIYRDRASPARAFAHLAELSASVSILVGTKSSIPHAVFDRQAAQAGVEASWVDGGHFFLQEDTDRAVRLVNEHTPSR